jgi:hypothetical protein
MLDKIIKVQPPAVALADSSRSVVALEMPKMERVVKDQAESVDGWDCGGKVDRQCFYLSGRKISK